MIATTLTLTGGWAIFAIGCIIYFIANQCYRYWLGQHATGLVSMYRPATVNPDCEFFIEMKD